jgi:large subunit ribosomal protein L21
LPGAKVTARIEEQGKDKKVLVFHSKKRKGYRKTYGHRQPITRLKITGIEA